MNRRIFIGSLGVMFGAVATALAQRPSGLLVQVSKSPTCGCCSKWIEHMREAGFTVESTDVQDIAKVKTSRGVPADMQSCHTAVVDGFVLEGHVPVADVQRLLKERPAIIGLAVPGMPVGSPGMEVPGVAAQPYRVMAFDKSGKSYVFASYPLNKG